MDNDEKRLFTFLTSNDTDTCITIKGDQGSGKTTIAKKMYNSVKIRCSFECLAWCQIKESNSNSVAVLRDILIGLLPRMNDEILQMRYGELENSIFRVLEKKKCLVVIDEVEFDYLIDDMIYRLSNRNVGYSKIMITSRIVEVGFVHKLRSLDEEESRDLLRKMVPNIEETYPEEIWRKLVEVCNGSRLAITTVGGCLRRHIHTSRNIGLHKLFSDQEQVTLDAVLRQLYIEIPYDLRTCLRYLGNFSEIQVENLFLLWIAENLLPPYIELDNENGYEANTFMGVAKIYLIELVERNLVHLNVDEHTGQFKSCRINDLIRNECLIKHAIDDFIQPSKLQETKSDTTSNHDYINQSRLAISLDELEYYLPYSRKISPKLLSALIFHRGSERSKISRTLQTCITELKLVRVLDLGGLLISKLDQAIGNLIHLKYLGLRNTLFHELPSTIQNMSKLQTLDLRDDKTQYGSILVPNILFNLKKLSYLFLRRVVVSGASKERLRLTGLDNLEILENFDPEHFYVDDLVKLPKLHILKLKINNMSHMSQVMPYILENYTPLWRLTLSINNCNFYTPEGQILLSKIILSCSALFKLSLNGRIGVLPEYDPTDRSYLTKLTLESCELVENSMSTLEMFPRLRVLKLKWNAFVGEKMVCKAQGFPQLRFLQLSCLNSLKDWVVCRGAMPNLSTLHIISCPNLEKIPGGLQSVSSLKVLRIKWMPKTFTDRLSHGVGGGKIGEDYYKVQHVSIQIINNDRENETARKKTEVIEEASDFPSRESYSIDYENRGRALMRDSYADGSSSYPSYEDYDDYPPNEVDHIWQLGYPNTTS